MPRSTSFTTPMTPYGQSVRGVPLRAWIPAIECRVLVLAGLHGEEPETTVILSRALRSMAEPPRHSACILSANPDGILQGTRGNANGVDLNRNFPTADWRPGTVPVRWHIDEPEATLPISTGSAPCSEPETAALISLIDSLAPRLIVALHAPLACVDDPQLSPTGRWLARETRLPLVGDIGYPTPGSMGTWARERAIPLITWEFPRSSIEELSRDSIPPLIGLLSGEAPGT